MATKTTGWYCVCTASVTANTDNTATITVNCYWQNDGWKYNIKNVSAWVYCNGNSYLVKDSGALDADSSNSAKVSCGSHSFVVNKSTSSQSIKCYAKITSNSSYVSGTKTSSNVPVSVKAMTSYTVKYNPNGGSGAPSNQTKWYNKDLTLSTTKPTKTGYTFKGWGTSTSDTSVDYAPGAKYTKNASITLYAIWTANTFTVEYNPNGGSGAPSKQTKTYGKTLTLSSTKPTRTNYTFKGWGTSSSSTTVAYAPGASYTKNTSIKLYAIWTLNYSKPKITSFKASRCDSSGAVSDSGTYALVKFSWSTSKTVSSITIQWKTSSATSYSNENEITVPVSGTSGSVTQKIGDGSISTDSSYNILVTVTDDGGNTPKMVMIGSTVFPLDIKSGGTGVAIGKAAEVNGFDVGYNSYYRKDLYLNQDVDIHGLSPDGTYRNAFTASNINGHVVIGYGNYSTGYAANTHIYGNDIKFGIGSTGKTIYRPYFKAGDSHSFRVTTAGYVSSSGTTVYFAISLMKPIIGDPTVTCTSVNGFRLRQNNKYTHGCTASTYVIPSKLYVEGYNGGLYSIRVVAVFSDTTNVTNNSPIGIDFSGSITFS